MRTILIGLVIGATLVGVSNYLPILTPAAWSQTATPSGPPTTQSLGAIQFCPLGTPITYVPFEITECGYYYFTGCLIGTAQANGVTVKADNVTIDLRGFSLLGVEDSWDGIHKEAAYRNLRIINGTIAEWGNHGYHATGDQGGDRDGDFLEDLAIRNNGVRGLSLGGTTFVSDCTVEDNGTEGLIGSSNSTVHRVRAHRNGGDGINMGHDAVVTECTSVLNGGTGIEIASGIVADCTSRENSGNGFHVLSGRVTDCYAERNELSGFLLDTGSSISQCSAQINDEHGIEIVDECYAFDNVCRGNDADGDLVGAGIVASGSRNRIEANSVLLNHTGIAVSSINGSSLIMRNNSSGNAPSMNYVIAAGNGQGPIVNVAGGGVFPSSDPWANFEH